MLINAQPRVVSVSRSFTPLNKPRKSQGLFEMPTNNLNSSCAATSAVSGALTNEAWDWGISSVDQENYTFNLNYAEQEVEASYYAQRATVPMTSETAPAQCVYGQAQAYYYARNPYTSSSATSPAHQYYASPAYCRPSNISRQTDVDVKPEISHDHAPRGFEHPSYSQVVTSEPSPYTSSGYGTISPAYLTSTTGPPSHYVGASKPWTTIYQEPALRGMGSSDGLISPSPGSNELFGGMGSGWAHSLDSSPMSPEEVPPSYQSYSFSDTSFSDTNSESEHTGGEQIEGSKVLKSQPSRSRRGTFEEEGARLKADQSYIAIAPNPGCARSWSSVNASNSQSSNGRSGSSSTMRFSGRTDDKDEFLIANKRAGLSYKEIRRLGRFKEAESTLRGRYRTLTKSKEERVRRPNWTEKDIKLLRIGVGLYGGPVSGKGDGEPRSAASYQKVKWMKVAEYIKERGGSYRFGNATCRKKWDELVAKGEI